MIKPSRLTTMIKPSKPQHKIIIKPHFYELTHVLKTLFLSLDLVSRQKYKIFLARF